MEKVIVGPIRRFFFGSIKRKLLFSFLLIALIPFLFFSFATYSVSEDTITQNSIDRQEATMELRAREINLILKGYRDDVLFFSKMPPILGIMRAEDNGGVDPLGLSTVEQWEERLEILFESAAKFNKGYMQMRYIDEEGNELVRVDSDGETVKVIPKRLLQNKKERYYFLESVNLDIGELYVSNLDLNREGSPSEIEIPFNPVIRYATPVFDDLGNRRGIVIVNVFGESITEVHNNVSKGESHRSIVDPGGFYLAHSVKSKMWGGPTNLNTGENVRNDYSYGIEKIYSGKSGIYSEDNRFFTYSPIFPHENEEYFWVALDILPKKTVLSPLINLKFIFMSGGLFFILIVILISLFFSKSFSDPIKKLFIATKKLEKGDYSTRIKIDSFDELGDLGSSFNETIKSLEGLEKEHKQIDKAKTEFLSITSHELRSPMTPMRAQLQMIMGNYFGKLNAKQEKSLEIVLRNTIRLDNIIKDFLEISRIEAARIKFRFVKTNLAKNIKMLVEEMEGFMPEKKISIKTNLNNLPIIETDPDRVMQVLRNLLNNAKKFSKLNSVIEVSATQKNNYILFKVKDNGVGIKQEDQNRLFDPFFQAEQTMYREHQGTGLGLAIVRGIVESQGGKVWLESEYGKGTTFFFTVPLIPLKDIQPIKILFSEEKDLEGKVLILFKDILGPMGEKEFNTIKMAGNLNKKDLLNYISELIEGNIIYEDKAQIFKEKISELYGVKKHGKS